jgi:hypothetical protein
MRMVRVLFVVSFVSLLIGGLSVRTATPVYAATNNYLNFQARILKSGGAVVSDGDYNVEFKLYSAASGGTALWTETYTGGDKITTKNGYISASLGSLTAFPSTINWDQELWISLNIGGTGSPSWDGEMTPRMKVTGVPYAFAAAKLQRTSGSYTSTLSLQAPTVGDQIFQLQDQGAAGTYNICIQNSASCGFVTGTAANFIQNQNSSQQATSNFWLSGTGRADTSLAAPLFDTPTAGTLSVGTVTATAISIGKTGITTTVEGALTVDEAATFTGNISQTGATTFSTGTGSVSLNGNTSVTGANTFTVGTGATSLGGSLAVTGATNLNGNVTIGDATTDTLTVTAQINSDIAFANGGARTIRVTDQTAANTAGDNLSILGAWGNGSGVGGNVTIAAGGSLGTTAAGGNVNINGGTAFNASGNGGNVVITGGNAFGGGTDGTISIGTTDTSALTLGASGVTTTNSGALTVSQLLTGNLGATISGAAINLNASSNFATNINTGTSTGAVNIGNSSAGAIALQSGGAINSTAGAASTISTSTGNLTLQAGSGTVSLGTSTTLTANGALTISSGSGTALNLTSGTTGAVTLDSGTTGAINIGTNANSKAITIGNTQSSTSQTLRAGAQTITMSDANYGLTFSSSGTTSLYSGCFGNCGTYLYTNDVATQLSAFGANINGVSGTGGSITFRTNSNSTTGFRVQNSATTSILNVDTTNNSVQVAGLLDTTTAATLNIGTTNATAISLNKETNVLITDANAFRVQSAAAADTMFNVDSSSNFVKVGNDTGTGASTTLLVVDSATTAPTGTNGAIYYDTTLGRMQCYEGGAWGVCGKSTLQDSYTASTGGTTPEIRLDSTRNGVDIQDTDAGLGSSVALFAVRGSATATTLGASLFQVNNNAGVPLVGIGLGSQSASTGIDLQFGGAANRTIQILQNTSAGTGRNLTVKAGEGNTGAGGQLILQGGNGSGTDQNGGNVSITGGTGTGTGVSGLVIIGTPAYQTATNSNCATNCTISQTNIDSNGAVIINATAAGLTISMPDPTVTTAGRVVYITAANGSNDFTLSVNGGGTGNQIAMRQNTTATMIWNGSDWTAAGASSSTTLQAAYDNTLTSAGGAEILLNNTASSDGLTVRNNESNPIIGAIFETQTSIGSNLFSVNNNSTEYASNGGAETAGGSATTFPSNTWSASATGGTQATVTRENAASNYISTGQASTKVVTTGATTANQGAANQLSAALTANLKYYVSFAVKGTANFSTLDVVYSRDGTNSSTTACTTGKTVTTGSWSRITCSFTAPASGITSSNAIFIRQSDSNSNARTYYIDNLSVNVSADINHAVDGSADDAGNFATNWTAYGAGVTTARDTSVIYDTSASSRADTPNNSDRGIRNNMAITPQINTQYLVSFYARAGTGSINDLTVRYSRDGGTNFASCVDYSTQTITTASWAKITCLFTTDGTAPSNPDLIITQATAPGGTRSIYVDALSITLNSNTASNVQIGGGNEGGPTTLFTLDRASTAPIADNNDAYLGSMYYDTTTGRIQCYEADGWGACGSAPDNFVNLNPEYAGAVLNGTGVGTMTADLCANGGGLSVNTGLCASGEAKNYYKWTSPQATQQTYSIYVSYQLPSTFKGFSSDDTVQLTARVDSTTNAAVTYEMFRNEGGAITQCGTGETAVTSATDTWQTIGINGNESTGCSFGTSSANAFVIFKINLKANSNANAYVSTLSFTTTGR